VKKPRVSSQLSRSLRGNSLLQRLLAIRNQSPDRVESIDKQIRQEFERNVAVLVLDMVGFSRLTIEYGIIHYLAMIHQMDKASRPAVSGNGGVVIKQEADNLYAIFEDPSHALEGALDIFRAFDAINTVVTTDRDIFGCIGIGYGPTLVIDEKDMFGSEVNLACKLGEDIAGKGEILLTSAAGSALSGNQFILEPMQVAISEMTLDCYKYKGSRFLGDGKIT